jgi:hypothetical protein
LLLIALHLLLMPFCRPFFRRSAEWYERYAFRDARAIDVLREEAVTLSSVNASAQSASALMSLQKCSV